MIISSFKINRMIYQLILEIIDLINVRIIVRLIE